MVTKNWKYEKKIKIKCIYTYLIYCSVLEMSCILQYI